MIFFWIFNTGRTNPGLFKIFLEGLFLEFNGGFLRIFLEVLVSDFEEYFRKD